MCENGCSEECSKDCLDDKLTRYEEALHISERGYEVILKWDIDEIMINNFNPEWIKAWDSNMDIQLCLDYYAVICYITDYYMKDESGTIDQPSGFLVHLTFRGFIKRWILQGEDSFTMEVTLSSFMKLIKCVRGTKPGIY